MSESLAEIYERHRVPGTKDVGHGDKNSTHSYVPEYERLLAPYRERPDVTLLEIGIAHGLSLWLWREYLPKASIIGVDISVVFDPMPLTNAGVQVIQADATKPVFIRLLAGTRLDVVIDDGSHMTNDQVTTFNLLKPSMKPGGLYVIEDIISPDYALPVLRKLHPSCSVIDLRKVKGRFDDMLVVYRF